MNGIDVRSDTVTLPTPNMYEAMHNLETMFIRKMLQLMNSSY